jgi:hypothetical protein
MSDKESYTNHARIIENTRARVVIQWRYPLVDVFHVIANYDEDTGWGDWADWYYTIYPDGVAIKKMHLWTAGPRNHEWQEGMAILGPDQHPEQTLETEPSLRLASMDYAVFPSWNHWPVAQMPSDGRYAAYPDRAAHYPGSRRPHSRMSLGRRMPPTTGPSVPM